MRQGFDRGIILGIVVLAGMIVGIGAISARNTRLLRDGDVAAALSREVLDAISAVRTDVRKMQAEQRAYLITGFEDWVKPYEDAANELRASCAALAAKTADDPDQHPRAVAAAKEIETGISSLTIVVKLRAKEGPAPVVEMARERGRRSFVDPLLEILAEMDRAERQRLAEREDFARSAYERAMWYNAIAVGLGLVAVLLFVWILARSIRIRARDANRLADQRELLAATLLSIGDGVIATDATGNVTFMNGVAETLTGWSNEAAQGSPLERVFQIINETTREAVENPAFRALKAGTIVGLANHTVLISKDGSERPIDDSAAPIKTRGVIRGAVLVFRDITERKRLEDELRQLAANLSEADHRKDEFLATLAHELRNPLAPIRNGLQIMRLAGSSGATLEMTRTMMERQLTQLVRLVDDLMDVSRISQGKLTLRKERIALRTVIASAIETSRPLIEEMGHELIVAIPETPIVVDADLTRLAQVFMNLLNNSAKYSERSGQIRLTVTCAGAEAFISVADAGIGIAREQLPRVFEMFSQIDHSLEKAQGGLGIGLSLVKRLVEMHGGAIEARSEGVGKGAEFIVRLPIVDDRRELPVPMNADAPRAASQLRILVVDDNRDGADSLSQMLAALGNETQTAYDGEEALFAAAAFRPDAILLDIGLPKLNGYEVCRRIREMPFGKSIIIIAQTGWGQDDDRERTKQAGFDHHMVKPVSLMDVEKAVSVLRQRGD